MSVKILTDVLTLPNEGLVGFTEEGVQVPLNHLVTGTIDKIEKEQFLRMWKDGVYYVRLMEHPVIRERYAVGIYQER
jgi:hypothetical protein